MPHSGPRTEKDNLIRRHTRSSAVGTVTGGVFTRTSGRAQRPDFRRYPDSGGQGPEADLGGTGTEPNPQIHTLTPNTVSAAAGPITVTVDGFAFRPSSVVEINQIAQTTTYVSGTRLTISFNPTVAATVQFTVRDGEGESNSVPFVVGAIAGDPAPDASWTKPNIVQWLRDRGVDMSPGAEGHFTKDELLAIVSAYLEEDDETLATLLGQ